MADVLDENGNFIGNDEDLKAGTQGKVVQDTANFDENGNWIGVAQPDKEAEKSPVKVEDKKVEDASVKSDKKDEKKK